MTHLLLALETSTEACSVALFAMGESKADSKLLAERLEYCANRHTELVLGMVKDICAEAQIELPEVKAIAFGRGPGSFTGLRIAASIAQGLAFGLNIPVLPISTLRALAQARFWQTGAIRVIACLDARRNEIYSGYYQLDENGFMESASEESLDTVGPKTALVLKPGWEFVNGHLLEDPNQRNVPSPSHPQFPLASVIAALGAYDWHSKGGVGKLKSEMAVPNYVRNYL